MWHIWDRCVCGKFSPSPSPSLPLSLSLSLSLSLRKVAVNSMRKKKFWLRNSSHKTCTSQTAFPFLSIGLTKVQLRCPLDSRSSPTQVNCVVVSTIASGAVITASIATLLALATRTLWGDVPRCSVLGDTLIREDFRGTLSQERPRDIAQRRLAFTSLVKAPTWELYRIWLMFPITCTTRRTWPLVTWATRGARCTYPWIARQIWVKVRSKLVSVC